MPARFRFGWATHRFRRISRLGQNAKSNVIQWATIVLILFNHLKSVKKLTRWKNTVKLKPKGKWKPEK